MTAFDDPPALRTALLWAAGLAGPEPDLGAIDLEALFALMRAHNLEARLARRLRDRPDLPAGLRQEAQHRGRQVAAELQAHVARGRQVVAQLRRDHGVGAVILKGFTAHALRPATPPRRIGDLDLIAADPLRTTEALLAMGWREHGERERVHAYSELSKDGLDIDLHAWFPVTALGPCGRDDVVPARNPGIWSHDTHLSTHRLGFEAILAESRLGRAPGTETVAVPRAELAVLLICAQMHRDYVISVFPTPRATFRLNDLVTAIELTRAPDFDPGRFARLIRRHDGQAAVSFVAYLAWVLTGNDPFGLAELEPETGWSTLRDLWWDGQDGFLVDLGIDPGELIVRTAAMDGLIDQLQGGRLEAGRAYALGARYRDEGTAPIERAIVRRDRGDVLPLRLRFDHDDRGLLVETAVPRTPAAHMTAWSFHFGDQRFELFDAPGVGRSLESYSNDGGDTTGIELAVTEDGDHRVRVRFPPGRLPRAPDGRSLALLLGVRQQRRPWGRCAGETIVPLHVALPPGARR